MNINFYSDTAADRFVRFRYFPDFSYKGLVIEVGGGSPDKISFSKHWRNNGWHSIVFEPNPIYYNEFIRQNIECYNLACSDKNEKDVDFLIADCNEALSYTSLGMKYDCFDADKIPVETIKVDTVRLDSFLLEKNIDKIDILSIDVEGWELEVIKGFDPSVVDCKIIILENYKHIPDYTSYMESIGYKFVANRMWDYIYKKQI
jgi:FkbM family methyltransferase